MKRGSDPAKVQRWHKRFARFRNCGQTVARFCRDEGISVPSFYLWKKKLADGPAGSNLVDNSAASRQKSTTNRPLANRALTRRPLGCGQRSNNRPSNLFQPIELKIASDNAAVNPGVTVRLPGGIEIAVGDNLLVIEQVVGQLLEHQTSGRSIHDGADAC